MKEKVEVGDDEPLDMLMQEILGEGNVFGDGLMAPFIITARTVLHFLAWYSFTNSGACTSVVSCQLL
jgi:hypothetical protein